jgi:enamine deaminase RidA (YjgF/YER057c/UK114 family)
MLIEPVGKTLLVSGTASIIGHESVHADDVAAQTRETIANINILITEANRLSGRHYYSTDVLAYKVYVRKPEHLSTIAAEFRAAVGYRATVTYLHADVCRRDLLVEIEAASSRKPTHMPRRQLAPASDVRTADAATKSRR